MKFVEKSLELLTKTTGRALGSELVRKIQKDQDADQDCTKDVKKSFTGSLN